MIFLNKLKKQCLRQSLLLLCVLTLSNVYAQDRQVDVLRDGWRFYRLEKNDGEQGFSNRDFDDKAWRTLSVPHDWGVEKGFDVSLENNTGLLHWKGIGWYRKDLDIGAEDKGKRIAIEFDGAMANAQVYLNGKLVGEWPYGYTSFSFDLNPYVDFGGKNKLAVRLDTESFDSRWYPGAGIYRNVRLVKTNPVHVVYNGVFVTTPVIDEKNGKVSLRADIRNGNNAYGKITAKVKVYALDENDRRTPVESKFADVTVGVPAKGDHTLRLDGVVSKPKLWSIETPNRYLAELDLYDGDRLVDQYSTSFGFRTIDFTPRDGFYLNGKRVQIKGVCNHHDLGPLGSAFYVEAAKRQLVIMKEMGLNALRTSHNPPAPEILDLCDKMGIIVQVEAFDTWRKGKKKNDYNLAFNGWHMMDLEAMIKRDRNHPSVVMWSNGNEMPDQWDLALGKSLYTVAKSLDPTRPISLGCNWGNTAINGFQKESTDVYGLNYRTSFYEKTLNKEENKQKGLLASETSSTLSTRGEYFFPVKFGTSKQLREINDNFQISGYDVTYPGWGNTPDLQFRLLEKYPAIYGEFVWTGFDYLGEPTPYNHDMTNLLNFRDKKKRERLKKQLEELGKIEVPSRSSYFGIVDLCGFKKDRYYMYQSQWRPELPMAHILPHWNWPGRKGKVTPVHVYTSGDEAELFLNGRSLGRQKVKAGEYRLQWNDVTYSPGTLKVVAYKDGKKWAEDVVRTTGKARKIRLTKDVYPVNGENELCFVTVDLTDSRGRFVADADNALEFSVSDGAEIIASDNGDPTSLIAFKETKRPAFNGKCLIIVKLDKNRASGQKTVLRVKGTGVGCASIAL
ncbi:beta-galactosidase GalB [Fulvitalea axinellae]